eukprot:6400619-Amphidinium_carterae.1
MRALHSAVWFADPLPVLEALGLYTFLTLGFYAASGGLQSWRVSARTFHAGALGREKNSAYQYPFPIAKPCYRFALRLELVRLFGRRCMPFGFEDYDRYA